MKNVEELTWTPNEDHIKDIYGRADHKATDLQDWTKSQVWDEVGTLIMRTIHNDLGISED